MQSAVLSADIGGTFTDVVLETDGQNFSTKVLTTHGAPELAIIDGMTQVCARAAVAPEQITRVIHGTTLATNALIERRGARTALITTDGFRDVIEMRTESRFEQYDLDLTLPEPLLPRNRRLVVRERVNVDGEVLIPLDEAAAAQLAEDIAAAGYESVAIGFLHAYANPDHERRMRDILLARLPDLSVSISSEVSPQIREYERFNTTIANAYVKPMMHGYLSRLAEGLRGAGVDCPVFLMHSGGGILSLEVAAEFPVRLVESGPAGGAIFAAYLAGQHGLDRVLSFDMGGTTAKICLIRAQTPRTARVFEVARTYRFKKGSGMPISIPVIDMVEIGAGGGSLAHVDAMSQVRVGPESAGSEPGPACYGRGGARPAVTDADLMLGRLDPGNFAGGAFQLDPAASEAALGAGIGAATGLDGTGAAFAVSEVVDENMANAARVHAVENGEDLAEYTMIAFGGAAPLHAGRLCEKLGIGTLLVPPGAGVGSALGFLRAPFSFEATRSVPMQLGAFDPDAVAALLRELAREAAGFVRSCDANAPITTSTRVFMRYVGQGWEIPVDLPDDLAAAPDATRIRALFARAYEALFARTVGNMEAEITVWSVNVTTPPPVAAPLPPEEESRFWHPGQTRDIFDPALERIVSAAVLPRGELSPGRRVDGPCVITELETTIIVPSSRSATCRADGSIAITSKSEV